MQSATFASPVKWNFAHTTWFFEAFLLSRFDPEFKPFDSVFMYLFNSYYTSLGPRQARGKRGLMTRPPLDTVQRYRAATDERVEALVRKLSGSAAPDVRLDAARLIELGLQHEQQHQELLLTDVQHLLWSSPLQPAYREPRDDAPLSSETTCLAWFEAGDELVEIGHDGRGFAYDNEGPRHRVYLEPFALASRLATVGEYRAFIEDGGYKTASLWLDEGWAFVQQEQLERPMYWNEDGRVFGLEGFRTPSDNEPVTGLSFFEAEAFARWSAARLPTEAEWERFAADAETEGTLLSEDSEAPLRPLAADEAVGHPAQLFGDCWEWTRSDYGPYPGYAPPEGPEGEYNGKFMSGKFVLRGGSCFTPESHIRATYRNFFAPGSTWQCSGLRLARDL